MHSKTLVVLITIILSAWADKYTWSSELISPFLNNSSASSVAAFYRICLGLFYYSKKSKEYGLLETKIARLSTALFFYGLHSCNRDEIYVPNLEIFWTNYLLNIYVKLSMIAALTTKATRKNSAGGL